jgi:hypothetical protein
MTPFCTSQDVYDKYSSYPIARTVLTGASADRMAFQSYILYMNVLSFCLEKAKMQKQQVAHLLHSKWLTYC